MGLNSGGLLNGGYDIKCAYLSVFCV